MGDVLAELGFTAEETVRPTDRALTRPGKAMCRVQEKYLGLPPEQRTPEVWMAMCDANNVNPEAAKRVAAFAMQMFPRPTNEQKPKPAKSKETP